MMAVLLTFLRPWILLLTMLPDVHCQSDSCQLSCQNGAPCATFPEGNRCLCAEDFTGSLCETTIDDCTFPRPNQCQHNSQCVDGQGNYTCACLSGWEGNFCEKEKNECVSSPCKNGASCSDAFDAFLCNCTPNYTGPTCTQDVDECSQTPELCKNGALCHNFNGGFNCSCAPGYTGLLCEMEIDECVSSPCHFGGTCIDLINNFRCECLPDFLGATCEAVVRQCQLTNPCGNGICIDIPQGGYQCFCKLGYSGDHCEFLVNLCASRPCRNGATCVNYGGNYSCSCAPGFTGSHCETDINECATAPCLNNATCTEPMPNSFKCQCLAGYTGSRCEIQINECDSSPCQGRQICIDLLNDYRCECPIGTTGALCETDVFDCRLTVCVNGGICIKEGAAYICSCPPPYSGPTCATSLDPCVPNPCLYGGSCYRVNETEFGCACADGYIGQKCEADVYDCLSNPCLNGGTCEEVLYGGDLAQISANKSGQVEPGVNQSSSRVKFLCSCPDSYTGTLCETEFLACLSSPCKNGATCTSETRIDYTCECVDGWNGTQCDKDINECLATPPVCLNAGQCINKSPGFSCVCPQHWTGQRCDADVLECAKITCFNGGTCIESIGNSSYCTCAAGYTGDDCSVKLSSCAPNPCQNNATCQDRVVSDSTGDGQMFTCQCVPGFTGYLCDANIDECTILKPCLNNATCLDAINGYLCNCQAGWTGLTCEENINECKSGPCQNGGNCTDLVDGFSCVCAFGYAGATCTVEVDECSYEPCRNNATCVDLIEGFSCQCLPGFTGVACSIDIDECASSPCAGSATCIDDINTFTCLCPPGFQGSLCEDDVPECSSNPCKFGGTCSEPQPALFTCLCPSGIEGDTCETISLANFDGRKALTFSSLPQLSNGGAGAGQRMRATRITRDVADGNAEAQLQFTITTTVLDGILLITTGISNYGSPQHMVLELRNSVLHFSASNGLQLLRDSITLTNQNVGIQSHMVQVTIRDDTLILSLNPKACSSTDGSCLSANLMFVNTTSWNLNGEAHFGGVAEFTPYLRNLVQDVGGFVGCLGNLMINGQLINLALAENLNGVVPEYGCSTHIPCLEGTCGNGGICRDVWVNKTCECVPGFSGPTCSFQNMAHFETDSMLHFESDLVITEIGFFFTAANASGLIMYTVNMDSLSLSLDNGQLLMQLILYNNGNTLTSKVGNNLHLQDWVRVSLQISSSMYKIEVSSDASGSLGSVTGTTGEAILVTGSMFWGALLDSPITEKWRGVDMPLPTHSIKGCLRDISINRTPLDLSLNIPLSNSDPPKARPGCEKEEACLTTSCQNGGVCVANWQGPTCNCQESYTGEDCSEASATTFDGKFSYSLIYLDRTKFSFGEEGRIEFRTRQTSSTLMLLQFLSLKGEADNFIEFRINRGKLQVYSSFRTDTVESKLDVPDGKWHSLGWVRRDNYFNLNLDSELLYLQTGFDPYQVSLNNTVQIFIGARPYFPGNASYIVEFFKGCMKGVSFDNVSIPYSANETDHPGLIVNPVGLISDCHGDDVCGVNSCPPNSYCTDEWNSYACPCLAGWEGANCSNNVDDCRNNSCRNGGTCIDKHLSYICQCGLNYTGQFCESVLEACDEHVCQMNNTESCVSVNATDYECNCLSGYTGKSCESLIDNCSSLPCMNNATCVNSLNNFTCICHDGFLGALCEIENYCYSLPCYNGGSCVLNQTADQTNDNTSFNISSNSSQNRSIVGATTKNTDSTASNNVTQPQTISTSQLFLCQCVKPYFGQLCENVDYCDSNQCKNNASCVLQISNYSCQCLPGFYGEYCENTDFCISSPCLNGGSCQNSADMYTCLCSDYYTGKHCETPLNQCMYNPCLNGATCYSNISSQSLNSAPSSNLSTSSSSSNFLTNDSFICVCKEGYTGELCESNISKCESSPCLHNGTCLENSNQNFSEKLDFGFRCICMPGFQGDMCEQEVNECSPEPCQNGGVCLDLENNFTCSCPEGFAGRSCSMDVRGCASSPCQNQGQCAGDGVNYTCLCALGFTGPRCETNIDDCIDNKCTNGGTCQDGINNYTCSCLSGYSGQYCTNITDSCYTLPCISGGVCSYQGLCSCPDVVKACGWYNETCQIEQCALKQECTPQSPSYLCNCSGTGYTGLHCNQDVDECSLPQIVCQNGGMCVNTVGSYTCDCTRTGYHGNNCETDNDECDGQNPCFNGGTCINTPGSFRCICTSAWEGQVCGQNKNDCLSYPCNNGGLCTDQFDGYLCNCTNTGYEGINCSQNVDDCVNNRCENGGQCIDGIRQYTCLCNETGYTGQFCQTKPTSCVPIPCHNNGTCSVTTNAVTCNCTGTGYNGQFCELALTQVQGKKSDLSEGALAAIIIIIVLVTIVIILVIIWQVRRRRKTRGKYKPAEVEGQIRNGDMRMNRLAERGERVI